MRSFAVCCYSKKNRKITRCIVVMYTHDTPTPTTLMFGSKPRKPSLPPPPAVEGPPPKPELEARYAALLEDLAIPEGKREQMILNEDDTKKWRLIQAHGKMQGAKNIKVDSGQYWIGCLEAVDASNLPTLTPEKAAEFETVIRTGHKKFLTEFVENDGVKSLLSLTSWYSARHPMMDGESKILVRLMEAYKGIFNNQTGMEGMLAIGDSISTLALATRLGGYNKDVNYSATKEAILLLAVCCFYSAKGRNMVVSAMDDMRRKWREVARFESLVKTLRESKGNNEFRAACMMFVTTIVNSAASVDARVKVRNDFIQLDIMSVMAKVVEEATDGDEHCAVCATQYQVFEDMMIADHAEVVHDMLKGNAQGFNAEDERNGGTIDLSSVSQIFKYLHSTSQTNGTPELLLELFQALMLIPAERVLAVPVWTAVTQFAQEASANAVLGKKRGTEKKLPKMNYAALHAILDERLKIDKNMQAMASTDDVVSRQRKKIEELQQALAQPNSKESELVKKLEEEVKLLREKTSEQQDEISKLKAQVFEEQKKTKAAEDRAAQAAAKAAAAPPAAGGGGAVPHTVAAAVAAPPPAAAPPAAEANIDPKLMKYWRMKKAGLPEGAIVNAMARDNVAVPPDFFSENGPSPSSGGGGGGGGGSGGSAPSGGLPKPPGFITGVANGGGAGAAAAAAAAAKPKGPQKPAIKPRVKMRGFFWSKVQATELEGTIWPEMKDDKVKLDLDVLESKYQHLEAKSATDGKTTPNGAAAAAKEKEKVHIVDGKRQQNVGIGVSKLRIPTNELITAIIKLDETILSMDRTKVLVDMCPTDDEISMLRGYDGDLEMLTMEDRFLYELTNVPRLTTRMKCVMTKHTFEKEALEIKRKLIAVREACTEIEKSKPLKTLLEIVLAIGNYLNGGTPRGAAWGFKLDSLEKLDAMKENEGKKSLIHFIVYILEKSYPGILESFRLPRAEAAVNISISETHNDMRTVAQQIRAIRNELQSEHNDKNDKFVSVFSSFQLKAEKQVQELEVEFQIVLEDFQRLGERYAESGQKLEPAALFGAFVKFQNSVRMSHEQLIQARMHDEKLHAIEEEKRKRMTLKKAKEEGLVDSKGVGVVDAFQKANQGDADSIVQGFRQRHRAVSAAGETE